MQTINPYSDRISHFLLIGGKKMRRIWVYCIFVSCFLWVGCDDLNTEKEVAPFEPANALVSQFIYPVYIAFEGNTVSIEKINSHLIEVKKEGARIEITSQCDSLAIFAYGNVMGDSLHPYNGQLKIRMDRDFALYLNGLQMRSLDGPAVEIQNGNHICYLDLPAKSKNILKDSVYHTQYYNGDVEESNACLFVNGQLYFDGRGSLYIYNTAPVRHDDELDCDITSHALFARGGIVCNYDLTANIYSSHGDAIRSEGNDIKLLKGTWKLYPAKDTINADGADVSIGVDAKIYVNDTLQSY